MNLADAITFILRSRGQSILQDFLRNDIATVLGQVFRNGASVFREGRSGLKNMEIKNLPAEILSSAVEMTKVAKVLPGRMKKALSVFQEDMLAELDQLKDPKEKTIFCLKVLGILASSSVSTFYNVKNTGKAFSPQRMNLRSTFARFLVAEFLMRSTHLLALRLLSELDKEVTNEDEKEHLKYFRRVLNGEDTGQEVAVTETDPAFRITEKLKKIILNGDDEA